MAHFLPVLQVLSLVVVLVVAVLFSRIICHNYRQLHFKANKQFMAIIAQPGILVINLFIIMATKTGRSHAYNDLLLANDLLLQISLAVFFGQHKYFLLPYFVRLPLGRILYFLYTISGVCVSCFALLPAVL